MTDAELIQAQHRVIQNMPCTCNLAWKHGESQPYCQRCYILSAYDTHRASDNTCRHGNRFGHDCLACPRGVAQVA